MNKDQIIEGLAALPLIVRGSPNEVFKAIRKLQEAAQKVDAASLQSSSLQISHCALCEDPSNQEALNYKEK